MIDLCKPIYMLASPPGQGKTTTAILLEKYFKSRGKKVACMQTMKGQYDTGIYLKQGCYHYTLPIEAAKNKESLEKWIPVGFDIYILEVTFPHGPIGAAFIDIFNNINEIISYEFKDIWKDHVINMDSNFLAFWELFNSKNVQKIITKTPLDIDFPCVDDSFTLHHPEMFLSDTINPKMKLPKSTEYVIAVGAFPAEFWDIYQNLRWYEYDYVQFMDEYRREQCSLAIIGSCLNRNLKLFFRPSKTKVICYQSSCYQDISQQIDEDTISETRTKSDPLQVFRTIKEKPVGTPLGEANCLYGIYNNQYWVASYDLMWGDMDLPLLVRDDNIINCNAWILPQYLISEGYLGVL